MFTARPKLLMLLAIGILVFASFTTVRAALPDPATGGKEGGAISVLFLMGPGAAGDLQLDPTVAKQLTARGFHYQVVSDLEPLTPEYLHQFNSVVVVGIHNYNGGSYYNPGGLPLLNTAANVNLLHRYVADGGGLVLVASTSESGSQVATMYADALAPWKLRVGWEVVRDDAHPVDNPDKPGDKLEYAWTKAITPGPLTEGVHALAYPMQIMRWDDIYPTLPLYPEDPAWQVLARGEATSKGMRLMDAGKWKDGDAGAAPVLAAARSIGKGRIAALSLGGYYLLTAAYSDVTNVGEATTGPLHGIAYARGDGKTPSDWGIFFDNLVRWTAEAGTQAGFGGKPAAWESRLKPRNMPEESIPDFAVVNWKTQQPPPTWAHHAPTPTWWRSAPFYDEVPDPLLTGPQHMNKVLIGAHTRYSDGKGSIAEWAKAAKAAGYQAIVFTETFEKVKPADWPKIVEDCLAHSNADFACLQGVDIADSYGNRFLLLGNNNFPTAGMLTADGKALQQTSRLSLGFSGHIAVVHRPAGNKTLPYELYRHFQAVSVYTYAETGKGKYGLADDGLAAYQWQLNNASNPVPMVVHELFTPGDVKAKATIGYQQIVPSQDARDAIRYFRYGMDHFFENPQRYFITEGPIIDGWAIFNKDIGRAELNRDHFRAIVGAHAAGPGVTIREAVLYDRGNIVRRWTPNAASFTDLVDGEIGFQRHYMLVVTDSKGRKAISPHLRTVPFGYFSRCADRQNWFGAAGSYTGIWPSGTHGVWYVNPSFPTPAEKEIFGGDHPLATKMEFPFASNACTITGYVIDQRYLKPVSYGMDAWRIENTEPSHTYELNARVGLWKEFATGWGDATATFPPPLSFLTGVDAVMRSRVVVTPTTAVFPVINVTDAHATYVYRQGDKTIEGKLDGNPATLIDLPAGATLDKFFLLTSLTVTGNGEIGWRAEAGKEVPKGMEWRASYLYLPREWRSTLGADGPTPWSMTLTAGKLSSVLGTVNLTAENGVVAGTLQAGGVQKLLPLKVSGLQENWPAALWTPKNLAYYAWSKTEPVALPGTTSGVPFFNHIGVFEGIGYASLENTEDVPFFVGNTLLATDPALGLAYELWTKDEAAIQVHNPTDHAITAQITSPKAIPGKYQVDTKVTVPAGSTIRLSLPNAERK